MKKHLVTRPFRTTVAALALGVSGILIYQLLRQPAEPTAVSYQTSHLARHQARHQTASKTAPKKPSGLLISEDNTSPLTTPLSKDISASNTAPSLFQEFNDWAGTYAKSSPAEQQKMLMAGDAMVKQRHEKMADLIENDPELALTESDALPPLVRDALPESLEKQLEQPVNARGDLTVIAYTGGSHPYKRFTTFGAEEYTVFPANEKESLYKELDRSLLGIKMTANRIITFPDGKQYPRVERLMALRKERVRVLNAEQSLVALKTLGKKDSSVCSVSAKSVAKSPTPVVIETGGASKGMCQPEHAKDWQRSAEGIKAAGLASGEYAVGGPGEGAGTFVPVPVGHSTGNKTFLCVRFRCSDQAETTYSKLDATIQNALAGLNRWSYGKITFTSYTLSPLILLPRTAEDYRKGLANAQNDAWAIAEKNYNVNAYSFAAICVAGLWSFEGSAGIVARTLQINTPTETVFQHELGHCFGLPHANFWRPTTTDPIGPGVFEGYNGSYDSMGWASTWAPFNTMNRFYIRWLTNSETHDLASQQSGIYKIYDPDVTTLNSLRKYTIRIPRSDGNYYFVEFRPRVTALAGNTAVDSTTQNGIRILRTNGAELIDVTPLSANGSRDAALLEGKEFYDTGEDISVKAVTKGGTSVDQYFDVEVLFGSRRTVLSGHAYLLRSIENNYPFGVAYNSFTNGAAVTRMHNNGSLTQKWVMMKVDGLNYKIINVNSGKALEVSNFSTANRALVQQWDYLGTPSQKWQIVSAGGSNFKVINAGSGLALSVPYITESPLQQLQQFTYYGASNQLWALDSVSPLNSGSKYSITARHSGKALDIAGSSVANGTYIYQWTVVPSSPFQKWLASTQGGAQLAFTNVGTQKVIEVGGFATGDGGGVQQWQWAGHSWQKWRLEVSDQDAGGFWYKLVNVGSSKAADVTGASASNGARIQQYSSWGGTNQQWRFSVVN